VESGRYEATYRGSAGGGGGSAGDVGAAPGPCPANGGPGHGRHVGDWPSHRRGGSLHGSASGRQRPRDGRRLRGGTGGRLERAGRLGGGRRSPGVGRVELPGTRFPVFGMCFRRTHCPSRHRGRSGYAAPAAPPLGRLGGVVAGGGRQRRERGRGDPSARLRGTGCGRPVHHAGDAVFAPGRGAVVERRCVPDSGQYTGRHRVRGGRVCTPGRGGAPG
jgi:hypothetical protein